MNIAMRAVGLASLVGVLGGAAPAENKPASKSYDPGEKVCEKIEIIGTRIASKRVCATRAEWEERRRSDRDTIEEAQRRVNGPCSTVGTHSGAPAC